MAAASGRENQFMALLYRIGELEGVYIFKRALCAKLFRIHSRLRRKCDAEISRF